ncbi:hypothetical protein [Bacterioplanoides pacificum]|uniref:EF-hand domain-containing protein n=1 Tax=Bacterioplanoides pacificum TaxID=1171596 RepID=A0ABV7VUK9_9GAMM
MDYQIFKFYRLFILIWLTAVNLAGCGSGDSSDSDSGSDSPPSSEVKSWLLFDLEAFSGALRLENEDGSDFLTLSWDAGENQLKLVNRMADEIPLVDGQKVLLADISFDLDQAVLSQVPHGHFCSVASEREQYRVQCYTGKDAAQFCEATADSDEDGLNDCIETLNYGTNPWQADTDGDGKIDGDEVQDFDPGNAYDRNNPRIADMYQFEFSLASVPAITLYTEQAINNSNELSVQYSDSQSVNTSRDYATNLSKEVSRSDTHTVGASLSIEADISLTPSVSTTVESSYEYQSERSQTHGVSFEWSESQSQANETVYQQGQAISSSETNTLTGGKLAIAVRLENRSRTDYQVRNLSISAFFDDPVNGQREPIDTLQFADGSFNPIYLPAPGAGAVTTSGDLIFTVDLTAGQAQHILKNSERLSFEPVALDLIDSQGQSLLPKATLLDRTAVVEINYGESGNPGINKRIAINTGLESSVSLADVLNDILGIDYDYGKISWDLPSPIEFSETYSNITSIAGIRSNNNTGQYWVIAHNHNSPGGFNGRVTDIYSPFKEDVDLNTIRVSSEDKISFIYVSDRDKDGLSDETERELGTNPEVIDTDNDGLPDFLEVMGWFSDGAGPDCSDNLDSSKILITSDPLLADTNENGVNDFDEAKTCQDPGKILKLKVTSNLNPKPDSDYPGLADQSETVLLEVDTTGSTVMESDLRYHWSLVYGSDTTLEPADMPLLTNSRSLVIPAANLLGLQHWQVEVTQVDGNQDVLAQEIFDVQFFVVKNKARARFVDIQNDEAGDGSWNNPWNNAKDAIRSLKNPNSMDMYVNGLAAITYQETIEIAESNSLFAGFDNWKMTEGQWLELKSHFTPAMSVALGNHSSEIYGVKLLQTKSSQASDNDHVKAMKINGSDGSKLSLVNSAIYATDAFTADGQDPRGISNYAISLEGAANLFMLKSTAVAGAATDGMWGLSGAYQAPGGGLKGGRSSSDWDTRKGQGNQVPWSNSQCDRHVRDTVVDNGDHGRDGVDGNDAPPTAAATFTDAGYLAGHGFDGEDGQPGSGGFACWSDGSHGGDGGSAGKGGKAGQAGGGSFALWSAPYELPGKRRIELERSYFLSGQAGSGGTGGKGSVGGSGKNGEWINGDSVGGRGGKGGKGGDASHGRGGLTVPILLNINSDMTFDQGHLIGGQAGNRGTSLILYVVDESRTAIDFKNLNESIITCGTLISGDLGGNMNIAGSNNDGAIVEDGATIKYCSPPNSGN